MPRGAFDTPESDVSESGTGDLGEEVLGSVEVHRTRPGPRVIVADERDPLENRTNSRVGNRTLPEPRRPVPQSD